jgi:hypothetical protein
MLRQLQTLSMQHNLCSTSYNESLYVEIIGSLMVHHGQCPASRQKSGVIHREVWVNDRRKIYIVQALRHG